MQWLDGVLGVLGFIAGAVVTALTRPIFAHFVGRARPYLKGISIGFATSADEKARLELDYSIVIKANNNPILPDLPSLLDVRSTRAWIAEAQGKIKAHERVMAHVQTIVTRSHLLQPGLPKDEQRRVILREWAEFGESLERFGLHVVQFFHEQIKQIYREPHPAEWQDDHARVSLTETFAYDLRELDVEDMVERETDVQGPVGVEEKLRRQLGTLNILRRFWIHLVEEDILWLLNKILEIGKTFSEEANSILKALHNLLAQASSDYLRVLLLASNDGNRAYAVFPSAELLIPFSSGETTVTSFISLAHEVDNAEAPAVVVRPHEAILLAFRSQKIVADLETIDLNGNIVLDNSQLKSLIQAKVLDCRIAAMIGGFGIEEGRILVSDNIQLGRTVNEVRRKRLRGLLVDKT